MAVVKTVFPATARQPAPRTGFAPLSLLDGGAGDPHTPALLFDATADEEAQFVGQAVGYTGGDWTVRIRYAMVSATSGNVRWQAALSKYTPGAAADLVARVFDTPNAETFAVPGTAGRMVEAALTLSNLDGIAAEDYFTLRLVRDADHGDDTATGDAQVVSVTVEYAG